MFILLFVFETEHKISLSKSLQLQMYMTLIDVTIFFSDLVENFDEASKNEAN